MFATIAQKIWDLVHAVRVETVGFSNSGLKQKTEQAQRHLVHGSRTMPYNSRTITTLRTKDNMNQLKIKASPPAGNSELSRPLLILVHLFHLKKDVDLTISPLKSVLSDCSSSELTSSLSNSSGTSCTNSVALRRLRLLGCTASISGCNATYSYSSRPSSTAGVTVQDSGTIPARLQQLEMCRGCTSAQIFAMCRMLRL